MKERNKQRKEERERKRKYTDKQRTEKKRNWELTCECAVRVERVRAPHVVGKVWYQNVDEKNTKIRRESSGPVTRRVVSDPELMQDVQGKVRPERKQCCKQRSIRGALSLFVQVPCKLTKAHKCGHPQNESINFEVVGLPFWRAVWPEKDTYFQCQQPKLPNPSLTWSWRRTLWRLKPRCCRPVYGQGCSTPVSVRVRTTRRPEDTLFQMSGNSNLLCSVCNEKPHKYKCPVCRSR